MLTIISPTKEEIRLKRLNRFASKILDQIQFALNYAGFNSSEDAVLQLIIDATPFQKIIQDRELAGEDTYIESAWLIVAINLIPKAKKILDLIANEIVLD